MTSTQGGHKGGQNAIFDTKVAGSGLGHLRSPQFWTSMLRTKRMEHNSVVTGNARACKHPENTFYSFLCSNETTISSFRLFGLS